MRQSRVTSENHNYSEMASLLVPSSNSNVNTMSGTASLFGGPTQNQFGSSQAAAKPAGSMGIFATSNSGFGNTATNTSIFGSNTANNANTAQTGMFGASNPIQASNTSSGTATTPFNSFGTFSTGLSVKRSNSTN